jgi:uncharacterized phage infection (PIP) family protein YhgE
MESRYCTVLCRPNSGYFPAIERWAMNVDISSLVRQLREILEDGNDTMQTVLTSMAVGVALANQELDQPSEELTKLYDALLDQANIFKRASLLLVKKNKSS